MTTRVTGVSQDVLSFGYTPPTLLAEYAGATQLRVIPPTGRLLYAPPFSVGYTPPTLLAEYAGATQLRVIPPTGRR